MAGGEGQRNPLAEELFVAIEKLKVGIISGWEGCQKALPPFPTCDSLMLNYQLSVEWVIKSLSTELQTPKNSAEHAIVNGAFVLRRDGDEIEQIAVTHRRRVNRYDLVPTCDARPTAKLN